MTAGTRIRQLRLERGYSLREVERRSGLLAGYTSRVENGHTIPTLSTLIKYAVMFGMTVSDLLQDVDGVLEPGEGLSV